MFTTNALPEVAPAGDAASTVARAGVCAVVVAYCPRPEQADHLAALASQVGRIVIVDNGSADSSAPYFEKAAAAANAAVVRMGRNAGIAAALNAGLAYARKNGYGWLLTLDQDSEPTPSMMGDMTAALDTVPGRARVALISPLHIDRRLGPSHIQRGLLAAEASWQTVVTTMTSGNLVAVDAAVAVGGWEERLFMDFVDHGFCLRLRQHGWQIIEATRAQLLHSLGRMELRRFLGRPLYVTNHTCARRYYISRNRMILWRRYWRSERTWCLGDLRSFLRETVGIVRFESDPGRKIWMTVRGMIDAFRNLKGPLET